MNRDSMNMYSPQPNMVQIPVFFPMQTDQCQPQQQFIIFQPIFDPNQIPPHAQNQMMPQPQNQVQTYQQGQEPIQAQSPQAQNQPRGRLINKRINREGKSEPSGSSEAAQSSYRPLNNHFPFKNLTNPEKIELIKDIYFPGATKLDVDEDENVLYISDDVVKVLCKLDTLYARIKNIKRGEKIFIPRKNTEFRTSAIFSLTGYQICIGADDKLFGAKIDMDVILKDLHSEIESITNKKSSFEKLRTLNTGYVQSGEVQQKARERLITDFRKSEEKIRSYFSQLGDIFGITFKNRIRDFDDDQIIGPNYIRTDAYQMLKEAIGVITPNLKKLYFRDSVLKCFLYHCDDKLHFALRLPDAYSDFSGVGIFKFNFSTKEEHELVREMFLIFNNLNRDILPKKERGKLRYIICNRIKDYPCSLNKDYCNPAIQKGMYSCTGFNPYIFAARHLFKIDELLLNADDYDRSILMNSRDCIVEKIDTLDQGISAPLVRYLREHPKSSFE